MQADTQVPASSDSLRAGHPELLMPVLGYAPFKVVADILLATVLLILLLPVIALLLLLVKCTSRGPALYSQVRLGRDRQTFTLYKIRSMHYDCERHTGPRWASTDDPRVTPLGRFLRKTHLDELPQLWNVIRGEMSLVGPRPATPREVALYEEWQLHRLDALPGITGLWQVSGRSELGFSEQVLMDITYIENWSLGLDLRILLRTVPAVLTGKGAF